MLILQRRVGESIIIGKDQEIEIIVLGVNAEGKVSIGIAADITIPVFRNELLKKEHQDAFAKIA
jgi:carbon storage regulator CsrA